MEIIREAVNDLATRLDKHGTFSIRRRRDYQLRLKIPLRSMYNLVLVVSRGTRQGCARVCVYLFVLNEAYMDHLLEHLEQAGRENCETLLCIYSPFQHCFFFLLSLFFLSSTSVPIEFVAKLKVNLQKWFVSHMRLSNTRNGYSIKNIDI